MAQEAENLASSFLLPVSQEQSRGVELEVTQVQ